MFELAEERPLDRLLDDHSFLRGKIAREVEALEPRFHALSAKLDEAFGWEEVQSLQDAIGDVATEWELFSHSARRLEWALFLAGHSAYELELVELAFGDATAKKYAPDAVSAMKESLEDIVSDVGDLEQEARRLKGLRDEFAHAGGTWRVGSPHTDAVQVYVDVGVLSFEGADPDRLLVFSETGFEELCNRMNQIVKVARSARRAV